MRGGIDFRARGEFWGPPPSIPKLKEFLPELLTSTYNARVDRLDAIRLLQALVAGGANSRTPIARDWVDKIAVRDMWLHGMQLASAIAYAEGEGWLADIPTRKGYISLTRTGEAVAKAKLP